jgi:hypothetical protein
MQYLSQKIVNKDAAGQPMIHAVERRNYPAGGKYGRWRLISHFPLSRFLIDFIFRPVPFLDPKVK